MPAYPIKHFLLVWYLCKTILLHFKYMPLVRCHDLLLQQILFKAVYIPSWKTMMSYHIYAEGTTERKHYSKNKRIKYKHVVI